MSPPTIQPLEEALKIREKMTPADFLPSSAQRGMAHGAHSVLNTAPGPQENTTPAGKAGVAGGRTSQHKQGAGGRTQPFGKSCWFEIIWKRASTGDRGMAATVSEWVTLPHIQNTTHTERVNPCRRLKGWARARLQTDAKPLTSDLPAPLTKLNRVSECDFPVTPQVTLGSVPRAIVTCFQSCSFKRVLVKQEIFIQFILSYCFYYKSTEIIFVLM